MPGIHEVHLLPHSAEQMFDLVADVGSYAEFLPWVIATRIKSDSGEEMVADMIVGFKSLREKFTSKVHKHRPDMIEVHYLDGPMRDLDNRWLFKPLSETSCEVEFFVDFTFRSPVFEALAGQYFDRAFRRMVQAFEDRALELYGNNDSSAHSVA